MATSRETRSAIFKLLGQIDHNIKKVEAKKVEAKKAEIDGKEKVTELESDSNDSEVSPFSQHIQEPDISDGEVLNGFLQGYNETNHDEAVPDEGKLFN